MDDGCWLHLARREMARVLCISSQTVFGPVGNSAAVPALQALGHEVMQIPTVLLSNHPGLGKPAGQATPVTLMQEMFDALERVGAFDGLAAVMTGYFTSAAQVITVAKQINTLKRKHENLHVLVDPVIGDHGKLYVAENVAEAIRNELLPQATITTPNLFELEWLTGETNITAAISMLNVAEVLITSIPAGVELETRHFTGGMILSKTIVRQEGVPNGTGDFLAGCYLAERLNMPAARAFDLAMVRLHSAVLRSTGSHALKLSAL
jgi:pyridoxine kinase